MTPKQKFMEVFLKEIFGFDAVVFNGNECGMEVTGIYTINTEVPSYCVLMNQKTFIQKEKILMEIWVDKLKTGGYCIRFKTFLNHIPHDRYEEVLGRVKRLCPNAKADIYYRSHTICLEPDKIPTLRLTVSKLPWK